MLYCYNCGEKTILNTKCTKCGSIFWKNPRCCAGSLIIFDNNLLLVRRGQEPWAGYWDIPGGYCEAHEHPKDCAIREAKEETGLDIEITNYHGIWLDTISETSIYGDNICIYYTARPINDNLKILDKNEILEIKWFSWNNLPYNLAFPSHIPCVLQKYRSNL